MPIPHVEFSPDAATAYDCVAWAAKSIISGQLTSEAMADVPASLRCLYRVVDELAERISGPTVWGDGPIEMELQSLAAALEVDVAASDNEVAGLSIAQLVMIARLIMAIIERTMSE